MRDACETCRFWNRFMPKSPWGVCGRIEDDNSMSVLEVDIEPCDCGCSGFHCDATLNTRHDFGCVQHEEGSDA